MSTLTLNQPNISFNNKRVLLKRSTFQMNDPIVIEQKYKVKKKSVQFKSETETCYFYKTHSPKELLKYNLNEEKDNLTAEDFKVNQVNWSNKNNIYFDSNTKIRMEQVQLLDENYDSMSKNRFLLEGKCKVLNCSFEKSVSIRYTLDLWSTYKEVQAEFYESTHSQWDRFNFYIPIQKSKNVQSIDFAIRYSVQNQDYWDNHHGQNYHLTIQPHSDKLFDTQPNLIKPKEKQQFSKRYDFTTSLLSQPSISSIHTTTNKSIITTTNSMESPYSPPLSPLNTPEDDKSLSQIVESSLFLNGIITPPSEPDTPIPIKQESIQLSYDDFISKYCFYNPDYNNSTVTSI